MMNRILRTTTLTILGVLAALSFCETTFAEKLEQSEETARIEAIAQARRLTRDRFHRAVLAGNTKLVEQQIELGADVNKATSQEKMTVLHMAAIVGDAEIVQMLLRAGAKTRVAMEQTYQTPLHFAARFPAKEGTRSAIVRMLIQNKAQVRARDEEGQTPLHYAAESGNYMITRLLINFNARSNARDERRRTPLHLAAAGQHVKAVETLLDLGARADARDEDKLTPLHAVIEYAKFRKANKLKEDDGIEIAKMLIEHGAQINALDDLNGGTPLHLAASAGLANTVAFFLKKGADVDIRGREGQTALHEAAMRRYRDVVKVLIDGGANPYASDHVGRTPYDSLKHWYGDGLPPAPAALNTNGEVEPTNDTVIEITTSKSTEAL